jgi:hypothetical protein
MSSITLTKTHTELATVTINGPQLLVQTWTIDPAKPRIQVVGNEYVFNKKLISQEYFSKSAINDMIRYRRSHRIDEVRSYK